jgi:hypothetical protein
MPTQASVSTRTDVRQRPKTSSGTETGDFDRIHIFGQFPLDAFQAPKFFHFLPAKKNVM